MMEQLERSIAKRGVVNDVSIAGYSLLGGNAADPTWDSRLLFLSLGKIANKRAKASEIQAYLQQRFSKIQSGVVFAFYPATD
ncbi:MAG: hypothetical protein R3C05_21025 [Pirellulaceae bacterium]